MPGYTVNAKSAEGFRIEVATRNHLFVIDQAETMGGKNEGPNPMEFTLAALAGCMVTVGKIIAMQERLPVVGLEVKAEADLDVSVLMGKAEGSAGMSGIKVTIRVDAPQMSREEIEAFVQKIEKRCPVTDNLKNPTAISVVVD